MPRKPIGANSLEPSRLLKRSLDRIEPCGLPALDVGCGNCRNTVFLAHAGFRVWSVDRDRRKLMDFAESQLGRDLIDSGRVTLICADLDRSIIPFRRRAFGLAVLVHYLPPGLNSVAASIAPGGYLFVETFGGHGGNWLELPASGALRESLSQDFSFEFYRERQVGKQGCDAVSAQLLAQKRNTSTLES